MFPLTEDSTEYRLLTGNHVAPAVWNGRNMLQVDPEGLTVLAEAAFRDVSHLLRPTHLQQLKAFLDDPESTGNDRYVRP